MAALLPPHVRGACTKRLILAIFGSVIATIVIRVREASKYGVLLIKMWAALQYRLYITVPHTCIVASYGVLVCGGGGDYRAAAVFWESPWLVCQALLCHSTVCCVPGGFCILAVAACALTVAWMATWYSRLLVIERVRLRAKMEQMPLAAPGCQHMHSHRACLPGQSSCYPSLCF